MKTKLILFVGLLCSALLYSAPAESPSEPVNEVELRRQEMRKEMQATYEPIGVALKGILEKVNLNQRPDAEELDKAEALLEDNKRNIIAYEEAQKANYMLLQAWVLYYRGDFTNSLNWAVRAFREDPSSSDAQITQSLFSYLAGRRPVEPAPSRPQAETRRGRSPRPQPEARRPRRSSQGRNGNGMEMSPDLAMTESVQVGTQPGTLHADLDALQKDFYRQRFNREEYLTVDGDKVVYAPGSDVLCILFWKINVPEADPNLPESSPQPGTPAEPMSPMAPEMTDFGMPTDQAGFGGMGTALDEQQAFFELAREVLADKKVMFIEMNTNAPAAVEDALAGHHAAAPLVVASRPQSGAISFMRLEFQTPFMAIVDTSGQVKYAGPAEGFMPAFVLTHLTGAPFDLESYQSAAAGMSFGTSEFGMPSPAGPNQLPMPMMPLDMGPMDTMPPATEQKPKTQSNEPTYRELPMEQEIEAEKRIAYVRDFFMKAPKKRYITYNRGVQMCRDIIRDYPGTKYAEEARQLLRQVPESKRELYHITNEELGL